MVLQDKSSCPKAVDSAIEQISVIWWSFYG